MSGGGLSGCFAVSDRIRATCRLQLTPDFGFREAAEVSDYLAELGVSHLYLSPVMQAASGSTHGYDVADPTRISDALGGADGFGELLDALERHDLGLVLDIVPNHMAVAAPDNPWWTHVLEHGPSSSFASHFDIDWGSDAPAPPALLLPILDTHFGRVLERGSMRVMREGGRFVVEVEGHVLPASPRSVGEVLGLAAGAAGGDGPAELSFLADALRELPPAAATDRASTARRHRDHRILAAQLERLMDEDPDARSRVDAAVRDLNGDEDALDAFMSKQNYRLASWTLATEEIGYRRFFHINELVALRAEDPVVFNDTHARVLAWVEKGVVDGLRVDHPDGLRDPAAYFRRLRARASDAWIVAEKILEPGEELREDWEVDGTTGYDFLNLAAGLQVDAGTEDRWTALHARFTGEERDYEAVLRECKAAACTELFGSDLNRLTDLFRRAAEGHRRHRDHTTADLRDALVETTACLPVYRSYAAPAEGDEGDAEASLSIPAEDARLVEAAVDAARTRRPALDPDPLELLEDMLLLRARGPLESELVMRFQQFTGPVAAKGGEDTALYRYGRFIALNEVGGDPSRFGVSPRAFHRRSAEVQEAWPRTMLTTSTHDTKRAEDVRARLHALSEMPDAWEEAVTRWEALVGGDEPDGRDDPVDRATRYFCYQTLVGAWPIDEDRWLAYLEKAIREAGLHTRWTNPDSGYEDAVRTFGRTLLSSGPFVRDLEAFVTALVEPGRINSLAQALLRLTAPGIPDLYQGSELWDLSLVDPDNRRPVDFGLRRRLLAELPGLTPEDILARSDEGLPKLHLTREALRVRREFPRCFGVHGTYRALESTGPAAQHVVAFARGPDVVTVVPRLTVRLAGAWEDTSLELPEGSWVNRLTGEVLGGPRDPSGPRVLLRELLDRFPAALLVRMEAR
ncbi:MAG: malto-oligosyltrehalose synthase [Gemmatimonadales bacterium]|nr:MAG: malto-oligosyltrehalose synthase [Gemmatimonadales bacterium]